MSEPDRVSQLEQELAGARARELEEALAPARARELEEALAAARARELEEALAAARGRESELRELLADAHDQLAQRDEELTRSALNHRRVEEMRRTRVWQLGTVYWGTRDRVRRRLGSASGG